MTKPTKEEVWKQSIRKAQQGDREQRDTLVADNIGLVYMVLRRFVNRGCEQEDLFQVGVIGLIKAIDKFDTTMEVAFSTYAVPMIIGEIRRFLRDDGMLHVSRQIKEHARKIAIAKEELKKNNQEPTMELLVQFTQLSPEEIVAAIEATTEVESIYQPVGYQKDGAQIVLADQLVDEQKNENQLIDQVTVRQLLEGLESMEARLIYLRYMEGKTQTECAKVLGMNQVAISRLEKKILLSLRKKL